MIYIIRQRNRGNRNQFRSKKIVAIYQLELKMPYNHHPINKLITELIVILWVFSKICSIVGHDLEHKHHRNHICDHHHPKAHNVRIFRYMSMKQSTFYSILANWTLLVSSLKLARKLNFEMRKFVNSICCEWLKSEVFWARAIYICHAYMHIQKNSHGKLLYKL